MSKFFSLSNFVFLFLGIILSFFFLKTCSPGADPIVVVSGSDTVHTHDTIIVNHDVVKYYRKDIISILEVPVDVYDSTACMVNRTYSDTLETDDVRIVVWDSVNGHLIAQRIMYQLSADTSINTTTKIKDTITIEVSVPQRAFYVSSGIGGGGAINHAYIGADFMSQRNWGVGYAYDLLQQTHNVFYRWKLRIPKKRPPTQL